METKLAYCFIFILTSCFAEQSEECKAQSIHDCLLRGYNKRMRPGRISNKRLEVNLKVYIFNIEEVDMKHQTVTAELSACLQWTDERLRWNKTTFENLSWIAIETEAIWKPDLVLTSQNAFKVFVDFNKSLATIRSDGFVEVWPFLRIELGTDIDISNYPFDEQSLVFAFEAWTYNLKDLTFKIDKDFDPLVSQTQNGEWKMLGFEIVNKSINYGDGSLFHQAGYRVFIKRRVLYYSLHIIGPVLLISLLNILCFVLPSSSGERVGLSMTIFLTLTVYLITVSDSLPKTSVGVAVIVIYLSLQMVGSAFTIISTVLIIDLEQGMSNSSLPKCIKRLILSWCQQPSKCCRKHEDKDGSRTDERLQADKHTFNSSRNQGMENDNTINGPNRALSRMDETVSFKNAASCLNNICLWLSILWNAALLGVMLMFVSV